MQSLIHLEYKKKILYDTLDGSSSKIKVFFSKHRDNGDRNGDRFYFRLEEEGIDIAYLYFYFCIKEKESKFIGLYVDETVQNQGYAQLLLSIWIQFCLNNGIEYIKTSDRQRKPFLLYLLKRFSFDCLDKSLYEECRRVTDICRKNDSSIKYLHFSNPNQEEGFRNSNILKEDNYQILSLPEFLSEDVIKLDKVFLLNPYLLQDNEKAYQKTKSIYERYKS